MTPEPAAVLGVKKNWGEGGFAEDGRWEMEDGR